MQRAAFLTTSLFLFFLQFMVLSGENRLWAFTLEEYSTPTLESSPSDLAFAPDGTLWVTLINANKIARLEPGKIKNGTSEGITEFDLPHPNSKPNYITVARDGSVWFSEMKGNRISRLNPATGEIKEFPIPTPKSEPHRVLEDDAGNIWFLEFETNKVGRLTPETGKIREFPVGEGHPHGIARTGGQIWYTQGGKFWTGQFANKLGVLDTKSGNFHEIPIPPEKSVPHGLTVTSDGTLWLTLMFASKIARLKGKEKNLEQFDLGKRRGPHDLVVDEKRGHIWFTASHPDAIGLLDLNLAKPGTGEGISFFPLQKGRHPSQLELGPDGSVWFTEMGLYFRGRYENKIGRIFP